MKIYATKGKPVEIHCSIYDFDNGKLRIRKGSKGFLVHDYNRDYALVQFPDFKFFSVYKPMMESKYSTPDLKLKKGVEVKAKRNIFDMISEKVVVKRGELGEVYDCRGKDFVRVSFRHQKPIGVHMSELQLVEN